MNTAGNGLNYEVSGPDHAPWVTLIPGIANDLTFWDDQTAALGARLRVLRYDPRGHGASDSAGVYDVAALMADIVGLWDHLGVTESAVVGLGFGGSLGVGLALAHPQRVTALVACSCRAVLTDDFVTLWQERAAQATERGMDSIVEATVARWFTERFHRAQPERIDAVRRMVAGTSVAGYVGHATAFTTIDWSDSLSRIAVPTLFVSAAADPGGGRADVMQQMADTVPNAQHVTVTDAGHLCNIENPTGFNHAVSTFLHAQLARTARRLGALVPADLSSEQREVYDAIASGPRARGPQRAALVAPDGSLVGPFNSMLLSPPVGMAAQAMGSALRFATTLTDREREIAILLVATARKSSFERAAHEEIARNVGVSDDEILALRTGHPPEFTDPRERAIAAAATEMLDTWNLTDAAYATTVGIVGERTLYELATIVGHYSLLALHLAVFNGE